MIEDAVFLLLRIVEGKDSQHVQLLLKNPFYLHLGSLYVFNTCLC